MKKEKFEITSHGMLPFIQFADLQNYLDSLSLKELQELDNKLSKDDTHPDLIRAAMAIYVRELGVDTISLTKKEIANICTHFKISVGLMHNVRIGHIKIIKGRMLMINDTASFMLTDQGIKSVEAKLK